MCVSLFICVLLYLPHGAMVSSMIFYCGMFLIILTRVRYNDTSKQHTAFSTTLGQASGDPGIKRSAMDW